MTDSGFWFRQRYDDAMYAQTEGMRSPVRCRWCGGIYDLGKVTVTARYLDCSMWKAPCCGVTADDRKPPWGVQHYTELPRPDTGRCDRALDTASEVCPSCFRQHTWLLGDNDVTFPDDPAPAAGLDDWEF